MDESSIYLIILFFLITLSSYFSASETAFSSVKKVRFFHQLKALKKNKSTHYSVKMLGTFPRTLSTILIANTIVNMTAASLSVLIFSFFLKENTVWISAITITILVLVFGEFLPKSWANKNPEYFLIKYTYPLYLIYLLLKPITNIFAKWIKKDSRVTSTEKELLSTVQLSQKEGQIEKEERSLIINAIKFDDVSIRTAYVPWKDVEFINDSETVKNALKQFAYHRYSRMPVLNKNGTVVGILSLKDIIDQKKSLVIQQFMRGYDKVSINIKLDDALTLMQTRKQHMLITVITNKKIKPMGIVTLEDIIEELVGEIYDETDDIPDVLEIGHHIFHVVGRINVAQVFKKIGAKVPIAKNLSFTDWVKKQLNVNNLKIFKSFEYDCFEISFLEKKNGQFIFEIKER